MSADIEARRKAVIKQAAEWYVRCMDQDMTLQECEEMHRWLEASVEHEVEFASMFRLDAHLILHSKRVLQ
ncbi:DUF4880 domain-containing protein [Steroidobacter sp. S1-65]|uniref:DUF4880 domain-containing protein n=1 Tax=Steroidobacter gossypii TaxID=2805490 RepID=A0ABS1WZQ1_9GAMM|nr:DUF4880 domain-containing protein [Steroidobacter gossypii]MBM0106464.1 DUF4880 domain-containing protein [Steroidobacter gossypii]